MPVSASDFSGTPGFNLPYHTTLKPTESAAWSIAREVIKIVNENSNLDLTWASNYFHNQVQRQIHDEYGILTETPTCKYKKTYSDGKTWGRADLSMPSIDGYTYIWEVKPVVYCLNTTLRKNTFEKAKSL